MNMNFKLKKVKENYYNYKDLIFNATAKKSGIKWKLEIRFFDHRFFSNFYSSINECQEKLNDFMARMARYFEAKKSEYDLERLYISFENDIPAKLNEKEGK